MGMNDIDLRAEQIEALETLVDYTPKLINGINTVETELSGERKEDTDEYLKMVIDGINWELGILNGCLDLIVKNNVEFDKETANVMSTNFSEAYLSKIDADIAASLNKDILPLIRTITDVANKTVAICK